MGCTGRILIAVLMGLPPSAGQDIRLGPSAFTDYRTQRPGVARRITVADLPRPNATPAAENGPRLVPRPAKAWPMVPPGFKVELFAAEHGSWNRATRTGYELIRVPMHQKGRATGEYEDFMTGFVTEDGHVWGRPVGVAVAQDGSLLVSDDGSNAIWRISKN